MKIMVNVSVEDVLEVLQQDASVKGSYESHEIIPMSDKPIGYLADHFMLRVHLTASEVKNYFLKAVPKNVLKRAEYLDETGFFSKEVKFYEQLVPHMLKHSSLPWAPSCYIAREDDFIIMQILHDHQTKSSKDLVLDVDHLKIAASTLAVFHASSLIFEERSGTKVIVSYSDILFENAYPQTIGHVRRQGLENAIEVILELTKSIPKYQNSPKLQTIIEEMPNTIRKIYKFAESSKQYRNVVSHGDLWVNNCMFKYDDGKPVECKIIDFQLARYAPPAFDLAQLVYINTTKETRAAHLDEVLDLYCKTFEMELRKFEVKTSILPREEILESFKEYHLAGLIEAVVFGHLTLLPPTLSTSIMSSSEEYDKFINQSRVKTCLKAFEEEYYRTRVTDIITEIVDDFIIPK